MAKTKKRRADLGRPTGTLNGFEVREVLVADLARAAAAYNPRDIDDDALAGLKVSTSEFGLVQPIVWNKRTGNVVGGHQRLKTLDPESLTQIVVVDLEEPREKALNLALNSPSLQGHWTDSLSELLESIKVDVPDLASGLRLDDLLLSVSLGDGGGGGSVDMDGGEGLGGSGGGGASGFSENYTRKIVAPVYEPKGDRPDEADLYDRSKTDALLEEIEAADVPDEVREFLVNAAERHTVFRFDRIAEYYAHAPAEVQDLMERSALVIVDFDRAIELGYVKLTETMLEQAGIAKRAEESGSGIDDAE